MSTSTYLELTGLIKSHMTEPDCFSREFAKYLASCLRENVWEITKEKLFEILLDDLVKEGPLATTKAIRDKHEMDLAEASTYALVLHHFFIPKLNNP